MGDKLKNIIINLICGFLTVISFFIVTNNLFTSKVSDEIWIFISISVFALALSLLSYKSNIIFTTKLSLLFLVSLVSLFLIIYIDSDFNEFKIINKILKIKNQNYYEGETRSSAITKVISDIYKVILVLYILIFITITKKNKTLTGIG